jgi:hypothetical protein
MEQTYDDSDRTTESAMCRQSSCCIDLEACVTLGVWRGMKCKVIVMIRLTVWFSVVGTAFMSHRFKLFDPSYLRFHPPASSCMLMATYYSVAYTAI